MILLGKNSKEEYKIFEGTIEEGNKKFFGYDWIESFETIEEAGITRNAAILDIPVETYKILRNKFIKNTEFQKEIHKNIIEYPEHIMNAFIKRDYEGKLFKKHMEEFAKKQRVEELEKIIPKKELLYKIFGFFLIIISIILMYKLWK